MKSPLSFSPHRHKRESTEAETRELWRQVFIRVCRDSGFQLSFERACRLTGQIVGTHPLLVWSAFPCMEVMQAIAAGEHPAATGAA
jgi:hypothetical protein